MESETKQATKFKAEKWTAICDANSERELWAVIMQDGSEAGFPCAFGSQNRMETLAGQFNECKGVLS